MNEVVKRLQSQINVSRFSGSHYDKVVADLMATSIAEIERLESAAAKNGSEQETDEEIDEGLSSQKARDNLKMIDFIADKIGLPHDQELSMENFLAWISGRRGESVGIDVSDIVKRL